MPERTLAKRLTFDQSGQRLGVASFHTASSKDGFYRILGGNALVYDLTPDKPLKLKYRVWVQEGEMTVAQCNAMAEAFTHPPVTKATK